MLKPPMIVRAVLLLSTALTLCGCQQRPSVTVTTFKVTGNWGVFTHDILITNQHAKRLKRVEVKLTVTKEQKVEEFTRYWNSWRPGEQKKINIPAGGGPVQRVSISGTAWMGAELTPVALAGEWSWSRDPAN